MKKILLPLEETDRSLTALSYVTRNFTPEQAEIVVMMTDDTVEEYSTNKEPGLAALAVLDEKLDAIAASLEGYKVTKLPALGKAGKRIVRAARETGSDMIAMTKSSKDDNLSTLGSTTQYVITNAPCDVVIVCETLHRNEYRGLVYKTASAVVNLRGLLGDKQSECLLPSVNVDCIYHFDVTVGKVRFYHTAYNPETRNWDRMPLEGQDVARDIAAGESADILVKADSTEGKADRIRIVNRDMKKEAVFTFKISKA